MYTTTVRHLINLIFHNSPGGFSGLSHDYCAAISDQSNLTQQPLVGFVSLRMTTTL